MKFEIPPLRLEFICPDVPLRTELVSALTYKGACPVPSTDCTTTTTQLRLVYELDGRAAEEQGLARRQAYGAKEENPLLKHESGLRLYAVEAGYIVAGEDVTGFIDSERGTATVSLGSSFWGTLSPIQRGRAFYLLTLPLLLLMEHQGYYPLHAAALTRGEDGVLISAPSGQGKTTAALTLIQSGWSYLSDDMILLHREDRGVRASSYRRSFSLTEETVARFPALAGEKWPASPGLRNKLRVEPDLVFPGSFRRSTRPRLIVFPQRAESLSRFEAVPARTVYGALITQSSVFASRARSMQQDYLEVLAALTRQCEAYKLLNGPDLLQHPHRLDELLQEVVPVLSGRQKAAS